MAQNNNMAVANLHSKAQGNGASTTLSSGVSDSDTSFPLTSDTAFSGEGYVIIDEGTANEEWAYATGKSGSALTIPLANRGLEGTTAVAHASGATVKGIMTAGQWNNLTDKLEAEHTDAGLHTAISLTAYSTLNLAEGQMLNGKIVPSVASNNLTVALKGMDGNDPSATNPVYVMLGGAVRTITSPLSVTKNAGTNWCNAGSSGLATKEIDYFTYLGYNATDGVVIGFSRIPYGTSYDSFSTTTTNERYCAISTITNATATDPYSVIGRFAATLSAGAGYTWTVPTFTPTNLIQKPIYETRELEFLHSIYTSGTAWSNGNGTFYASYQIVGTKAYVYWRALHGSTTSYGTGYYSFVLPINYKPGSSNFGFVSGSGFYYNAAASYSLVAMPCIYFGTQGQLVTFSTGMPATTNGIISPTAPVTWGNGHYHREQVIINIA